MCDCGWRNYLHKDLLMTSAAILSVLLGMVALQMSGTPFGLYTAGVTLALSVVLAMIGFRGNAAAGHTVPRWSKAFLISGICLSAAGLALSL